MSSDLYEHISYEEKIEQCNKIMEIGKKLFREFKYHQALEKYELAFKMLLPSLLDEKSDANELKVHEMRVLSNICACHLKLEKYRIVLEIYSVMSLVYSLELNRDSKVIQNALKRSIDANDRYLNREKKHYSEKLLNVLSEKEEKL